MLPTISSEITKAVQDLGFSEILLLSNPQPLRANNALP